MTFRKTTFIFIAILLSLLFIVQFWFIQTLTKDVSSKIGEAAFEVSRSTAETLVFTKKGINSRKFAISNRISQVETIELLDTLLKTPNDVNISLQDGQKDSFLTIDSSGVKHKIDIPRTGIEKSLNDMSNKISLSAIGFIIFGLVAASYFSRRLSLPLKALENASEKVGRGEFGFQVKNNGQFQTTEIKNTVDAFNKMSEKIKMLQQENQQLQQQAHFTELAEITRGLAHTIRNPLNTLNLAIDQLETENNTISRSELSTISKKQIRRIDQWVRTLMDVISSDSSLVETVNIVQLLESVISEFKSSQSNKTLIILDKSKLATVELQAIEQELKSVLHGLISNAIEATEQANKTSKSEANSITVKLTNEKKLITVAISDHGSGFSAEIQKKLFSPHNTNKTYGAGMGLYLAHRIISLKYQGELVADNNSQGEIDTPAGATVSLTLNNRV